MRTIPRSRINPAPYNPRAISEYARKQLHESLRKFGLVETLVWNETTGNLVSGHQRLMDLDRQAGYPARLKDYELAVSVVSLDLKREKELNVWLNNRAAQGNFEPDKFFELLQGPDALTLDDIGFTRGGLEAEFGDLPNLDTLLAHEDRAAIPAREELEAIKARKKQVRAEAKTSPSEDADYMLMVVFDSRKEKNAWLRQQGMESDVRFLSAAEMFAALKVD